MKIQFGRLFILGATGYLIKFICGMLLVSYLFGNIYLNISCRLFKNKLCSQVENILQPLRLAQHWSMFAPDMPKDQTKIVGIFECGNGTTETLTIFDEKLVGILERIFHVRKFRMLSQITEDSFKNEYFGGRLLTYHEKVNSICESSKVLGRSLILQNQRLEIGASQMISDKEIIVYSAGKSKNE